MLLSSSMVGALTLSAVAVAEVHITKLSENVTATDGSGNVAAAGNLKGFGDIGVGAGINWQDGLSYGGGLQAGSADFGLGGGFNLTKDKAHIGLGIGINAVHLSANVDLTASTDGTVSMLFLSTTGNIHCEDVTINGTNGKKCTSSVAPK